MSRAARSAVRSSLALLIAVGLGAASLARAAAPRAYLSWHAPHGYPGASRTLVPACDDTSAVDSLFLSIELPSHRPAVASMIAVIEFHPLPGDTLGSFWFFRSGWPNERNMWIDLEDLGPISFPSAWTSPPAIPGEGEVSYDHRSGVGRLGIRYTLPPDNPAGLDAGKRYCVARVRIQHRRQGLEGCGRPVCVRVADLRMSFATGRELRIAPGELSQVGWNAPPEACSRVPAGEPSKP